MGSFKIIPHTADLRLKIEAIDLLDLFSTSLTGLNYVIKKDFEPDQSMMDFKDMIQINSLDSSMLLVDFLSKVLTLSHQNKSIFYKLTLFELSDIKLKAELTGCKVNEFIEDVKAVTYNETKILVNDKGNFETIIVLDV
jgi:SHS2 domain-containing protein